MKTNTPFLTFRHFLFLILFAISLNVLHAQNGFTNKEEAKNETINYKKQGKWIEYYGSDNKITTSDKAIGYRLIVYKDDEKSEILRLYYMSGKLNAEVPYTEGKKNGLARWYYENGSLKEESMFANGEKIGKGKPYSEQENVTPKQDNAEQIAKKDENISRGSGDPLKGLNVSKAKEITSGKYYALIIGIDKYSGQWHTLNTAVHDAQALQKTLSEKYKIDKFYTLFDAQATRSAIMNALDNLVNTMQEDDNVIIYFSDGDLFNREELPDWTEGEDKDGNDLFVQTLRDEEWHLN